MIMLDLLGLIPSAHLRQHLRGLESVGWARLSQAVSSCLHNFREDPNELILLRAIIPLSLIPGLQLLDCLGHELLLRKRGHSAGSGVA
jgi:hypothetical protein